MKKLVTLGYLTTIGLFSCGPTIDYTKSERQPIDIVDVKILREYVGALGSTFRDAQFKVKNTTQSNCQLICVEYREGIIGNRIGRSCTSTGNFPPLTFAIINATGQYMSGPYNAWCYTNLVYVEPKK